MSLKSEIRSIEEALDAFGVTLDLLTDEEKRSLDEQGYIMFYNILDEETLETMRERYEYLMEKEGPLAGIEVHQEKGTRRLSDLVNKGDMFDKVWLHPKLLACVYYILKREFKLSSLNGRDACPGEGNQQLHADWRERNPEEPYQVVNSVWMLDDFTAKNGATRLVPATHNLKGSPKDYTKDPSGAHPDQIMAIAPAGSVLVFNSHLWHGGTTNQTDKPRRALFSYYVARDKPSQTNFAETIRLNTFRRLSPAARYILGVD